MPGGGEILGRVRSKSEGERIKPFKIFLSVLLFISLACWALFWSIELNYQRAKADILECGLTMSHTSDLSSPKCVEALELTTGIVNTGASSTGVNYAFYDRLRTKEVIGVWLGSTRPEVRIYRDPNRHVVEISYLENSKGF